MLWILGRRKDPHILLVGENGVGKSELVNGLAVRLVTDPPSNFKAGEILRVSPQFLTDPRSFSWLTENHSNPGILYIPDGRLTFEILETIHTLIYRDGVRIIAGVAPREYEKILEKDPGLIRRFQIVRVEPMDELETMQILRTKKLSYEQHHQVWIDDSALEMALLLSLKYTTDKAQPGAALDLLDEACSMVAIKGIGNSPKASSDEIIEETFEVISERPVTALEITEVIAAITGKSVEEIEKELEEEE
jgi:ATP-dependent Clp protease ATP-binding subunit ClpC